jgi:hypothetical protein
MVRPSNWPGVDVDSFEQALTVAIEDFRLNYEEYFGAH